MPGLIPIGVIILAPSPVRTLDTLEPLRSPPHTGGVRGDARHLQGREHRPRAVDVVGPPTPKPGPFRSLLSEKEVEACLPDLVIGARVSA